jgi:hypothetical protein
MKNVINIILVIGGIAMNAFNDSWDLGRTIHDHEVKFRLYPELWENFEFDEFDLTTVTWHECKFLNSDGNGLSIEMSNLPNDKGGIYFFVARSAVLPEICNYLMYIGRSKCTKAQSLKRRCRNYFTEYNSEECRPRIYRLIKLWGEYLYLRYIELEDNRIIDELEAALINSLLPPFNFVVPNKKIRAAIRAFD